MKELEIKIGQNEKKVEQKREDILVQKQMVAEKHRMHEADVLEKSKRIKAL